MIFIDNHDIDETGFLRLLAGTKNQSLTRLAALKNDAAKLNGDDFETLVYDSAETAAKHTEFEGHVIKTARHEFPDIVAKRYFGMEVKVTKENKWMSTGNSILETTRVEGVERIYMFFGKLAGGIDIRYRPYQECLYEVGVTHSPRYKINMELPEGQSIFDKMGESYDELRREENPIGKIKEYYRKQLKPGDELWWIDPRAEEQAVNPIITPFRKLPKNIRERVKVEAMILFPEIFSRNRIKFERTAAYLITGYNATCANVRDVFTSGGQVVIKLDGVTLSIPQIFYQLKTYAKEIKNVIAEIPRDRLLYYWRLNTLPSSRIETWKDLIDHHGGQMRDIVKPSKLYEWGLQ